MDNLTYDYVKNTIQKVAAFNYTDTTHLLALACARKTRTRLCTYVPQKKQSALTQSSTGLGEEVPVQIPTHQPRSFPETGIHNLNLPLFLLSADVSPRLPSFLPSFLHSFTHSFIYHFIHSLTHSFMTYLSSTTPSHPNPCLTARWHACMRCMHECRLIEEEGEKSV